MNASYLDRIHLYMTFQKDEAEILYCHLSKCALLGPEVEPMLAEDVKNMHYNGVVLLLGLATEDEDVVHVDDHDSFVDNLLEDVVHNCLECHWVVCETK